MLFFNSLIFAMSAAALSVTAPTEGSSISQSGTLQVTWSTVSTDTQDFNIELALSTDSGNEQTLTTNVSPSTLSYSTSASSFAAGNYTVNLVGNTATSSGILAQSKWFLITASSAASSARASSTGTSTRAAVAGASAAASTTSGSEASGTSGASGSGAASSGAASSSSSVTKSSGAEKAASSFVGLVIAGIAALLV